MLFLGRILRCKFYSKHGGYRLDIRSIVLRLGRYRILLECRSLYPLSSDLCILKFTDLEFCFSSLFLSYLS